MATQVQPQDLKGGVATPGNNKVYGTDDSGNVGFQDLYGTGLVQTYIYSTTDGPGEKTITHNLGVTQTDVESGRYFVDFIYKATSGIVGGVVSINGHYNDYTPIGIINSFNAGTVSNGQNDWTANTLTVYFSDRGGDAVDVKIRIWKNR